MNQSLRLSAFGVFFLLAVLLMPRSLFAQSCDTSAVPADLTTALQNQGRAIAAALNDYYSTHPTEGDRFLDPSLSAPSCVSSNFMTVFTAFIRNGSSRGTDAHGALVTGSATPFPADSTSPGGRFMEMNNYLFLASANYAPGSASEGRTCTEPGEVSYEGMDMTGGSSSGGSGAYTARGPVGTIAARLRAMAAAMPGAPRGRRGRASGLYVQYQQYLRTAATYSALSGCLPPPVTVASSSGRVLASAGAATPPAIPATVLGAHAVPPAIGGLLSAVVPGSGVVEGTGTVAADSGGESGSSGGSADEEDGGDDVIRGRGRAGPGYSL